MTEDDLAAMEARAAAATPGPWTADRKILPWLGGRTPGVQVYHAAGGGYYNPVCGCDLGREGLGGTDRPVANAAFIAAARTDVPALLAEVRRLRARLAGAAPVAYHEG